MPNVTRRLANRGITFTNAFVSNPLCCPSRVSFLTGQYSHTSGVWNNDAPYGGFEAFTGDASTVATRLADAGYRTALVGKYMNQYWRTNGQYVPPGWSVWESYATEVSYYDYTLTFDGTVFESHGSAPEDYATDVLAADAESFIRTTPTQKPLLLWFAPPAPHEPSLPAPRHVGTFASLAPWRPPTFDERDVSDKPPYVTSKPRLGTAGIEAMDQKRQMQLESLLAVDEAVGRLVEALSDTGRLGDTLILFTSDNGFMWGEHRLSAKTVPYEESIRIPLVMRWDRLSNVPRTSDRMVVNVDVAPTITAATGTARLPHDGRSLIPLLEDTATTWRTEFVLEHQGRAVPSYCGIRGTNKVFVHYADGSEEFYRLGADPYQKSNAVSKIRFVDAVARLRERARARCQPRPPEMVPF
jgi:arylsulfatase A-like enzyme